MKRAFAAAAFASALSAIAPAAAETILKYEVVPLSRADARRMWTKEAPDATGIGDYAPWAMVARVQYEDGQSLTITQLWSNRHCGVSACPFKVFQGDELVAEDDACSEPDHHAISEDARVIRACSKLIRTNRK